MADSCQDQIHAWQFKLQNDHNHYSRPVHNKHITM